MSTTAYQLVDENGKQYPIGTQGLSIGRQRGNQIVLVDGKVSRRHAVVQLTGQEVVVIDQSSANGTFVNGRRVTGQAVLTPGSSLQIGSHVFRLATSTGQAAVLGQSGTRPQYNNQRTVLVFIVGAAIVLLAIFFGLGGGGVDISRFFPATSTYAPTAPVSGPTPLQSATLPVIPTLTYTPETQAVAADGAISCTDLDLLQARHDCSATNLGATTDIFWVSFINMRDVQERGYALSVVSTGEKNPTYPNRRGRVSLGNFQPGETRQIAVQMYCIEPVSGCPAYTAHVQLLVEDGFKPIYGMNGEFEIRNDVAGTGLRATRRPVDSTSYPIQIPTDTPSDLGGGTSTP